MSNANTRKTYFLECWRAVAAGIVETAGQTFLLLIAVRVFAASPTAKALLASSQFVGLILSLFVVAAVTQGGWAPARAGASLVGVGALAFGLAALVAFHLVAGLSVAALGWASAGLIVLASLILAREIQSEKADDPGTALLKNATEPSRPGAHP